MEELVLSQSTVPEIRTAADSYHVGTLCMLPCFGYPSHENRLVGVALLCQSPGHLRRPLREALVPPVTVSV